MNADISKYTEVAELLKVFAHPVRLCIVKGLLENGGCNVTHMKNCLEVPQSTVSQHLQKLKAAGIVKGEREGLEVRYKVCDERAEKIIKALF